MNDDLKEDIIYLLSFVGVECWGDFRQDLENMAEEVKERLYNIPEIEPQRD